MEVEERSIDDLIPYARNSRTHSPEQIAQVAASITEFGFTNPVLLDGSNGIIAGHGRVQAARKLGMATVPCIELAHLTDTQKRAYIIADNKLALNAGWDDDMMAIEFDELKIEGFDLELTGFDQLEVDAVLADERVSPDFVDEIKEECTISIVCEDYGERESAIELLGSKKISWCALKDKMK